MAITTYSNLKTTIASYLNREDLTAYLGDFITLAESRLNRELRVREMVEINTSTIFGIYYYPTFNTYLDFFLNNLKFRILRCFQKIFTGTCILLLKIRKRQWNTP